MLSPVFLAGQRRGEIRIDVPVEDLVAYVVEQSYLASLELDRSEAAVGRRFRRFVVPVLKP